MTIYHSIVTPASARTQTARPEVQCAVHLTRDLTTAPPTKSITKRLDNVSPRTECNKGHKRLPICKYGN